MGVYLAAVLEGLGAHLFVAGFIALMKGLQAAPFQALCRPGRGVAERGAERLVAAEVLARQLHMTIGAGKIKLTATRPPEFFPFLVGLDGARAGDVDLAALTFRMGGKIGGQLG